MKASENKILVRPLATELAYWKTRKSIVTKKIEKLRLELLEIDEELGQLNKNTHCHSSFFGKLKNSLSHFSILNNRVSGLN